MAELTNAQKKAIAIANARLRLKGKTTSSTNIIEQGMSGVNEGIASFAGMPVDVATSAINAATSGVNSLAGTQIPPITDPVGGAGTFKRLLAKTISERQPQTVVQRYARRIGQEVGYDVPASALFAAAPVLGAGARANMPMYMAGNLAGDLGSGIAGQTAQEVLPENKTAQIAASLLGGVAGAGAVSMMTPKYAVGPTLGQVKADAAVKRQAVAESDARITPESSAALMDSLKARLEKDRANNPLLFPRANATVEDLASRPVSTFGDVEDARRFVGRNVAANADESAIGVGLKKEIDNYLNNITPSDVTGSDPQQAVADLFAARGLTHKAKKAEVILNKEMRGETRAATTGTGGNEVNAIRQNIRAVFDKERDPTLSGQRQGFTPDEMKAMEGIVMGSPTQNLARALGRFSPTSGALAQMATGWGGASGATAAVMGGSPLLLAPAAVGGIGFWAKALAEKSTRNAIDDLVAMILKGAPREMKPSAKATKAAVLQQLLSGSLQQQ